MQLVRCDYCSREMQKEDLAGKIYFAPILPGRVASIMANYSHHADACSSCATSMLKNMKRRKPRKPQARTSMKQ